MSTGLGMVLCLLYRLSYEELSFMTTAILDLNFRLSHSGFAVTFFGSPYLKTWVFLYGIPAKLYGTKSLFHLWNMPPNVPQKEHDLKAILG